MSKSNKKSRRTDKFERLKDSTRDREIRAARHKIRQLLKDGEFEELDEIDEGRLEKENGDG